MFQAARLVIVAFWLLAHSTAGATVAPTFALDGQLYADNSAINTLRDTGTLTLRIFDPGLSCVLYEEQQNFDTTTSNGSFHVEVGSDVNAVKRRGSSGLDQNNSMAAVYSNSAPISGLTELRAGCSYVPAPGDERRVRVIVHTNSDAATRTLSPDFAIASVPSAVIAQSAETLGGLVPGQFLQLNPTTTPDLTQAHLETLFQSYTTLETLLQGGSPSYVRASGTGAVLVPSVASPSTPAAISAVEGQIWYDSASHSLRYSNGSAVETVGAAGSGITSLNIGAGLTSTAGTSITTGGETIAVNVGTGAGQLVQLDAAARLPAVDGSSVRNLTPSLLASGTIGSGVAIATDQSISTLGSLVGADVRTRSNKIFSGTVYVEQRAPSGLAANYAVTWPGALPTGGTKLLSGDASGQLGWVDLSGGLVTNQATLGAGSIWIGDGTGKAQPQTPGGDVSVTNGGVFSVNALRGTTVSNTQPSSSGQVLRFDQTTTQYLPQFVAMTDLRSKTTGTAAFGASCAANQTLTYDAVSDQMACQNISLNNGQLATGAVDAAALAANAVSSAKINATGIATNRLLITNPVDGTTVTYASCATDEILKFGPLGWTCSSVGALAPVTSVAGKTGAVTLNALDIGGLGTAAVVDVGTEANQIARLDGSGRLPAVDGSLLVNINATSLQARAVSASAPTSDQVLAWNATTSAWTPVARTQGVVTSVGAGSGLLGGPITGAGTLSVDIGTGANQVVAENGQGQILQSGGTPSAPGYGFAGGPGTGLYSTGVNQMGLSVSGTSVLSISSAGDLGVGTNSPATSLDLSARTDAIALPRGSTAQQPSSAPGGSLRFNSTTSEAELFDGSSWLTLSTGAPGTYYSETGGTISGNVVITPTSGTALTITSGGARVVAGGLDVNGGITANGGSITNLGSNITGLSALSLAAGGTSALTLGNQTTGVGLKILDAGTGGANYVTVTGAGSGSGPTLAAGGTDASVDLNLASKGTGSVHVTGRLGVGTSLPATALDVNGVVTATGFSGPVTSYGYTQTSGDFAMSGTGAFSTASGPVALNGNVTIHPPSGTALTIASGGQVISGGGLDVTGGIMVNGGNLTGLGAVTSGTGALNILSGGVGSISLGSLNSGTSLRINDAGATSANYITVTGAGINGSPTLGAGGTDANVNLLIATKGTGNVGIPNGNLGVGTSAPATSLDLSARTDAIALPRGSTAQQPATAPTGSLRFNSTTSEAEVFDGASWMPLATGAPGTYYSEMGGTIDGNVVITPTSGTALTITSGGQTITAGGLDVTGGINARGGSVTGLGSNLTGAGAVQIAAGGSSSLGFGNVTHGTSLSISDPGATSANYLNISGAGVGAAPILSAIGSDTNVGLTLATKGAGNVLVPNGRVGLGTNLPASALDVNGVVTATGFSGPLTSTGYTQSSGNFAMSGTGSFSTATGDVSLNGNTTVAANRSLGFAPGTGQFVQTYSGAGPAASITDTSVASGNILDLVSTSTQATDGDKGLNVSIAGANANAVKRYGVYSSVTASGTSSTNVAGYFSASGAGTNYGLLVPSGLVGVGTLTPATSLDLSARTDAVALPRGSTAQQPATAPGGSLRFNSTTNAAEIFDGTSWQSLSTGAAGTYYSASGGTISGNVVITPPSGTALTITSGGQTIAAGGLNVTGGINVNGGLITGVGSNMTGVDALTIASGGTSALKLGTQNNGPALAIVDAGATAANFFTMSGAAAGQSPLLAARGSDANVNLTLQSKGTGAVNVVGRLGVGTSAPTSALEVAGVVTATGFNGPVTSNGYTQTSGNFTMTGTGSFSTATGPVALNGNVTITPPTGTGLVIASGGQTINAGGLNVTGGIIANGGDLTNLGASVTGTGALSVSAGGSNTLSLGNLAHGPGFVILDPGAVAANSIAATGAAAGAAPSLGVVGTDANINLALNPKGTGSVVLPSAAFGIGTTTPTSALDLNGALTVRGLTSPAVAGPGAGRIYFDATTNQFMISQNGGAYAALASSGTSSQLFTGPVTMSGAGTGLTVVNNESVGGNLNVAGNITLSGTGSFSSGTGNVLLNGPTTVAANQSLILAPGTGRIVQNYAGSGPAVSLTNAASASGDILDLTSTSTNASNGDKGLGVAISGANASSNVTRYGTYSNVTATGTGSTNVAGYFSATGGTNNFGLLVPNGNVGIGTSVPLAGLDVATTGSLASALIVPRDSVANRPNAPVNGMIRYATDTSRLEAYQNGTWQNLTGGVASGAPLSGLSAAASTNAIDNTNFAQAWNWSTATTQSVFGQTGNALTTGSLHALTSSSPALSSTNGLLYVGNTGTSTSGVLARFQANGSAASGITILANGNVGVGSNTPASKLEVVGSADQVQALVKGNATQGTDLVQFQNSGGTALSGISPSGRFKIPDGTGASVPGLQFFSNSSGLGLFRPATDVMAFATAGLERVRIDASGNVGIGTAPSSALQVNGIVTATGFSGPMTSSGYNQTSGNFAMSGTGTFTQSFSGTGPAHVITSTLSGDIVDLVSASTGAITGDKGLSVAISGTNASANVTRYGTFSAVTAAGAGSTNVAGYFSATGGTNNYGLLVPNGNVGIGTATPANPLHVNGIAQIDNGLAPPSFTTRSAGTRLILYPLIGASTVDHAFGVESATTWQSIPDATRQFLWYAGTTPIFVIKGSGSVGIGTTAPTSTLEVNGDQRFTGATGQSLRFGTGAAGTSRYISTVTNGSTGTDLNFYNSSASNPGGAFNFVNQNTGTSAMTILATGNVGIGSTAPGASLDVAGQIRIQGGAPALNRVLMSDATGLATWGTVPSPTTVSVGTGSVSAPSLSFAADTNTGLYDVGTGTLGVAASGVQAINVTSTSVNIPLGTTNGGAASGQALNVSGGLGVGGPINTSGALTATGQISAIQGVGTVYTPTGATTSLPAAPTLLANNASNLDGTAATVAMLVRNSAPNNVVQRAYMTSVSATGTGYSPALTFGQQTAASSYNERMRIDSTGNVGIGTTTPSATLEVGGTIVAANFRTPSVNGSAGTVQVGVGDAASGFFRPSANVVALATAGSERWRVDGSGNMGLGTISPQARLDVNGTIQMTGAQTTAYTSSSSSLAVPSGVTFVASSTSAADNGLSGTVMLSKNAAALSQAAFVAAVSTTGTTSYSPSIVFGQATGTASYSERLRIDPNGNVGIGTTLPSAPLNVIAPASTAAAASFLRMGSSDLIDGIAIGNTSAVAGRMAPTIAGQSNQSQYTGLTLIAKGADAYPAPALMQFNASASTGDVLTGGTTAVTLRDLFSFQTKNTQVMVIGATGRVGLGTAVPISPLEVVDSGTAATSVTVSTYSTGTTAAPAWNGRRARGSITGPAAVAANDRIAALWGSGHNGTAFSSPATGIVSYASEAFTTTANGAALAFETTGTGTLARTERMRIDSTGMVGIGSTTPGYPLDVVGSVRATSFVTTSDGRLKREVRSIEGLDLIRQLRGVRYRSSVDGQPNIGVIAQEIERVLPEAVVTDARGYKAVEYSNLVAPLIESTKELYEMCHLDHAQIKRLQARLEARDEATKRLVRENNELRERLDRTENRLRVIEEKMGISR